MPTLYYHPRMLAYDFGPSHPLRPERLRRTVEILKACLPDLKIVDPPRMPETELLRVHDPDFIATVKAISAGDAVSEEARAAAGFSSPDNPPFPGMYDAALAYCDGSYAAAREVVEGASLSFGLAGGLHHAHRAEASGFCIFNDPALAISVLRERFNRVAYVDIDVHHGDGVQWIFYDDPSVMTCSIHQDGRTLYPGTGGRDERGADNTSVNVPLMPGTGGEEWIGAFRSEILPALERFKPDALVLQLGTDAHALDPLARLKLKAQDWAEAVRDLAALGLPTVALGGGGYEITCVPRMWVAATMILCGQEPPDRLHTEVPAEWRMPRFWD